MALTVGELVGYLKLDTRKWDAALVKARAQMARFGPATLRGAESVGKVTNAAATAASALGVLSSAGVATAGAVALLPGAALLAGTGMATLAVATSGFGDAMASVAMDDPAKFAEALGELAPAAQATAVAVRDLRPEWDELTDTVQQAAFAGVADQVRTLGRSYLPVLAAGMSATAAGFNRAALDAAGFLGAANRVRDVRTIMDNSATATGHLSAVLRPVVQIMTDLGAVGTRVFADITTGAGAAVQRVADLIARARESGQLERLMRGAVDAIRQLSTVAKNVAVVLGSIFTAALPNGAGFLDTLTRITDQMAAWSRSAEGQHQLAAVFGLLAQVSAHLSGVLPVLGSALGSIVSAFASLPAPVQSVIASMLAWTALVGLLGARLAPVIGFGAKFVQAATTTGTATNRIAAALGRGIAASAAWVARMTVMAATTTAQFAVMAARGIASVTVMAARVVAQWVVMSAGAMARAAIMAASWVVAMGPVGWVIAAVVGLVALIVANWDTVVAATSAAWTAVSGWVSNAWQWCVDAVRSAGTWIVNLVTGAWTSARDAVTGGVNAVVGFVQSLPGRILGALSGLGSLLVNSGRALLQGLWRGISGAVGWIKSKIAGVLSSIRNLFPFSPAREGPFSGSGYTTFSGRALITDFARAISADGAAAVSAAEQVAGGVRAALAPGTLAPALAAPARLTTSAAPARPATTGERGHDGASVRPVGVDELRDALAGMNMTLDERGGRLVARMVNRVNTANRRR